MTTCQACGGQINSSDRYCRSCGAPVASLVGDLVDTHPFKSTDPSPEAGRRGSEDPTEPFYRPPAAIDRLGRGASLLHQTGSLIRRMFEERRNVVIIVPLLVLLVALLTGTGITAGKNVIRRIIRERVAEQLRQAEQNGQPGRGGRARTAPGHAGEIDDGRADESVQNALGFVPADLSNDEYPDIDGVFVESLTRDDSPAGLAHVQAGDVLTEFGDKQVSDTKDVAGVLESIAPVAK